MPRKKTPYGKRIKEAGEEISVIFNHPALDVDLRSALCVVGDTMDADRSYIFLLKNNGCRGVKKIESFVEWCKEGIQPDCNILQDFDTKELSWWMDKLVEEHSINYHDTGILPREAEMEKAILDSQNVMSIVAMPIFNDGGSLLGFVYVDSIRKMKKWGSKDEHLLKSLAVLFSGYIERRKEEIELRRAIRVLDSTWRN